MSTTIQKNILLRMRKLLNKPENWCKLSFAQTKSKVNCMTSDPNVYAFCLFGALIKECDDMDIKRNLIKFLVVHTEHVSLMGFNDSPTTTHKDIINFLDEMIKIS